MRRVRDPDHFYTGTLLTILYTRCQKGLFRIKLGRQAGQTRAGGVLYEEESTDESKGPE